MLSNIVWNETVEELISNPSSGDRSNNFEDFEIKISDSSYFRSI